MAYTADIEALGCQHHWTFDSDSTDNVGSADGTDTGVTYPASSAICEDASVSAVLDARTERVTLPTTTTINNSAQLAKAVCGWFMSTAIQTPPVRIYGEGTTPLFQFVMAFGNNVMLEIGQSAVIFQVYGPVLQPNRAYHLCGVFEGNIGANIINFYVDGVKQLLAQPLDREPDTGTLNVRGIGEFGDPVGTSGIGFSAVTLFAPNDGYYSHWAAFSGTSAQLTDTEVRVELFEKGALPDVTISTGTESAMQTALDVYADTERDDAPLCIRVEPVTGGGDFELELDNITFDPLASIHVQYTGTDTLTLINTNGADCSITSAIGSGGEIELKTRTTIMVSVKDVTTGSAVAGARCYIEADTGGDLTAGTEIMNTTTSGLGVAVISFDYTSNQPIIGKVRKGSATTFYNTGTIAGPITSEGLNETVLLIPDE